MIPYYRHCATSRKGGASTAANGGRVPDITFEIRPTPPFRLDLTVWALRRRHESIIDRWDGGSYQRTVWLDGSVVGLTVAQKGAPDRARLEVRMGGAAAKESLRPPAEATLERMLGLRTDLADFYRFATGHRRLARMVERFRGLKPPRFPTVFEALVNAISCQQLSLAVGIILLGRLTAAYGRANGATGRAFPRPQDLANARIERLRKLGYSCSKGTAIVGLARCIARDGLDVEILEGLSDDEAYGRLTSIRGIGRWSGEYVLLRGLGRLHVFPGDDVGARKRLARWLGLKQPLDYEGVRRALARLHPYAGLIYFHMLLSGLADAGFVTA